MKDKHPWAKRTARGRGVHYRNIDEWEPPEDRIGIALRSIWNGEDFIPDTNSSIQEAERVITKVSIDLRDDSERKERKELRIVEVMNDFSTTEKEDNATRDRFLKARSLEKEIRVWEEIRVGMKIWREEVYRKSERAEQELYRTNRQAALQEAKLNPKCGSAPVACRSCGSFHRCYPH
jgi:hypothetical protein